MKKLSLKLMVIMILLLFTFAALPISAQNYWLQPGNMGSISLEIFKPKFQEWVGGERYDLFSTVWLFTGNIKASENLSVIIEIPISNFDYKDDYSQHSNYENQTSIGNPYIGLEVKHPLYNESMYFKTRIGGRPPVASDEKESAAYVGYRTLYGQLESFIPDLTSISGGGSFGQDWQNSFNYSINLNGVLMIPEEGDSEIFLDYSADLWITPNKFNLGVGIFGRWLITEDDLDFGEATIHQLGIAGNYNLGKIKPGIHIRCPLDTDYISMINIIYGVNLTVNLE